MHKRANSLALRTVPEPLEDYFYDEPTANHGKGVNPPRTINHHLSLANGFVFGSVLQYALVCRFHLAGSKKIREERRTTFEHIPTSTANPFVFAEKPTGFVSPREVRKPIGSQWYTLLKVNRPNVKIVKEMESIHLSSQSHDKHKCAYHLTSNEKVALCCIVTSRPFLKVGFS
ncbi:hypothetical protein AVEN_99397-1 [Araneus ventricosus]|uniref:Uncharacterized protein n=1 Tax=Araneus ventricosus TaxID=182803 RepID=A0A4Y1ZWL2_ARAVE|nr:hypothetical protein AVEN_99397-1 [Araneus ventricosus]